MTSNEKVSLRYGAIETELSVIESTEGPGGIDISKLIATTGLSSYDQGFVNTSSTKSAITFIDGDQGILRHRGYPIEELAAQKTYLDVVYLLVYGELPNSSELEAFDAKLRQHSMVHPNMVKFFETFEPSAHPMAILSSAVSVLSTFYNDSTDPRDPEQIELSTIRLLAKLPVLTAYTYKSLVGESLVNPDSNLSLVENFLSMTFGHLGQDYAANPVLTKALDTLLLLHADHEQNCSTSTVRLVGSSQANLFASISSGINALSGPLHGGANEAVLDMLNFIHESGDSVQKYVERVKNKEDGIRLMGFGHRVYKSFDPRAKIVKAHADEVLRELGVSDPLLDIAKELEAAALADSYFVERKLYPNVDFYTGVIYKAMGFPARMFTPLFAVGRLPGWIAHWREQNADSTTRIGRPQQVYTGPAKRSI
ncbi:citrate synthase [Aquiluna borgnonia]|uniref:Citrate synthase n=1 Tax=Aquiluna borgnonia TaxID=2499157 RepID=A0A7D4PQK0_9MICO|nr:citrate synthase [Aquiluna borgnonia]QKJ25061.1 citrate synthase [Aquiluna borgnonia]